MAVKYGDILYYGYSYLYYGMGMQCIVCDEVGFDGKADKWNWHHVNSRADLVGIGKDMTIKIIEIKISRADFLQEIKAKKYEKCCGYADYFYYLVPDGLVSKDEVPKGLGLLYLKGRHASSIVKAQRLYQITPERRLEMIERCARRLSNLAWDAFHNRRYNPDNKPDADLFTKEQ